MSQSPAAVIGVDLGGTKLATAVFEVSGLMRYHSNLSLGSNTGPAAGALIREAILDCIAKTNSSVKAIGVAVPGISRKKTGTVWAPNIQGWDDYPLLEELQTSFPGVQVVIESDRSCYIMGEHWQGNAREAQNALFLSFGTGIGAGILVDGRIMRGAHDIAGAIGWWTMGLPFQKKYVPCGFFEHHASGEGLRKIALEYFEEKGMRPASLAEHFSAADIFTSHAAGEVWARHVVEQAVTYWGMAAANLISVFDPEVIIFGGGVFGPAVSLIPAIQEETKKWAQPVAAKMVAFVPSSLGGHAGVYGAGYFALQSLQDN